MTVLISLDVPEEAGATNLSWIMRGFFGSICECYTTESIRRPEAFKLCLSIVNESHGITDDEKQQLKNELAAINLEVHPKESMRRNHAC